MSNSTDLIHIDGSNRLVNSTFNILSYIQCPYNPGNMLRANRHYNQLADHMKMMAYGA